MFRLKLSLNLGFWPEYMAATNASLLVTIYARISTQFRMGRHQPMSPVASSSVRASTIYYTSETFTNMQNTQHKSDVKIGLERPRCLYFLPQSTTIGTMT